MLKRLLPILVLTVLVASILVGCSQGSPCPSTLTILSITEGDVSIMKAGVDSWAQAQIQMELEVGDTVKTGDDSGAEITFFDGSTMELEAGTQIEITSLDVACDTGVTTINLLQTLGTTISRVTKILDPASSYAVETPTGVASVRGSILRVQVIFGDVNYEDGTSLFTNDEGSIWASSQGVELQIPEGQTCIVIPDQPPNLIPTAQDDVAITDEDNPVSVVAPGVLTNDSDPDVGDALTVTSVDTSGTVGTVVAWAADGSFTYDPDGQFEYLKAGSSTTASFTYTVSDGRGGNDTATVTITINGVNDGPTGISLSNDSVAENQPTSTWVGDFSTTDPDAGDILTYSLVGGEGDDDNASFNITDSQLQTAATFDYETRNSYSIRVRTTDSGALYFEEAFNITITNANDPPVAVSDNAITSANTPVTIDVLTNDFDADGDTLTVDSVTQGTNGSVINNSHNVTYIPAPGFNGTDSFNYTVSDGHGGTDTAVVNVTVTKTLASINVQIDIGPTASIFIWDDTAGAWAIDEDTQQPVDGTNHVTSATITVAGGHYYYVWVEAGDAIYYVKHCPNDWVITSAPVGDAEAAYGLSAADSLDPIHFTTKVG
ncbi:MAG: Ig-like domain-containing protein [Dehalococcoidia bacterium]|nr:Ig-like domain-containing protein [Dehalococcoidia bacterium]